MGEYLHNFKGIMKAAGLYHEIRWNVQFLFASRQLTRAVAPTRTDQQPRLCHTLAAADTRHGRWAD